MCGKWKQYKLISFVFHAHSCCWNHRPRQATKCTSACASYSTQCTPESFLSCAKSLALSLKAPHVEQGWFLVFSIPQNKCFQCQWKYRAHLCLVARFQIMAASHMSGKSFFAVTWKAGLTNWFGWKTLSFPPCPQPTLPSPPVVAVSCFPSPVHYTTSSYSCWARGEQVALEPPSSCSTASCACWRSWQGAAAKEERSVSPGGRSISSYGRSKHLSSFLQGMN